VRPRDHGQAQRVRHALLVRLAVGRKREHRLEQRLELERGPNLAHEVRDAVARVPEPVRGAGRHGDALAGAGNALLAADLEADRAREHLEALLLPRVDVCRRDEPIRLHVGLDHDGVPAGLLRRLSKDDALAGDGVLDALSCTDHLGSPLALAATARPVQRRSARALKIELGSA